MILPVFWKVFIVCLVTCQALGKFSENDSWRQKTISCS